MLGEDIEVQISGPLHEYEYTYEIENWNDLIGAGDDHIDLKVNYEGQFYGYDLEIMTVNFRDLTKF